MLARGGDGRPGFLSEGDCGDSCAHFTDPDKPWSYLGFTPAVHPPPPPPTHAHSLLHTGISVAIMFNSALKDIKALSGLSATNGDLVLSGNKALSTLQPLSQVGGEEGGE